ncbi:hypothetical protein HMPREF9997_00357 [Corynebacterium durum F0235]|uniref:Uncharacterized protein n=1 Tax=Corynebacterium durum F0235 TaxID=1035195 RepID=L1MLC0_9CORY|nr:hypothetical protein HMPREF9997_00357 [Corynebacterium durum F0235]
MLYVTACNNCTWWIDDWVKVSLLLCVEVVGVAWMQNYAR